MTGLSDIALKVLTSRYFRKDDDGKVIEDWDGLVARVSGAIARAELCYASVIGMERAAEMHKKFLSDCTDYMGRMLFLPNSPTLMNAGVEGGQLSACFCLQVDDDIESIFDTVKEMALIFKSGGGVGLPMSRLRPKGDFVKSTGGVSSGPVSFMRVYNTTAEVVAQGGKRRGALMGVLRVDHPDIMEFIRVKQDLKELTSFNLSVAVTDTFMKALSENANYDLVNPRNGRAVGSISARGVWNEIVQCAWATGEPGIVFIDEINRRHMETTGLTAQIEGTNPCVTGDTRVAVGKTRTERVVDLVGKPVVVYVSGRYWATGGFFHSGKKKVYTVTTEDGLFVNATLDHTFFRYDGYFLRKAKLMDLKEGDDLPIEHPVLGTRRSKVVAIVEGDEEDVYDIQVPGANAFVANNILIGNCGEVPLLSYESCNLASINLAKFVKGPYTAASTLDVQGIEEISRFLVRFLDNVITVNSFPIRQIANATLATRKIGIGVMGFADMLVKMGVPYGSAAAIDVLQIVLQAIKNASYKESEELAKERGAFPACSLEFSPKRRNATLMAIAPTGSISMIADVTGGIEPMFAPAIKRQSVLDGEPIYQVNSAIAELLGNVAPEFAEAAIDDLRDGSSWNDVADLMGSRLSGKLSCVQFAHEIAPNWHVHVQSEAQIWVDSAVSKTVNVPSDATVGDISETLFAAWKGGCKGISVYRDGCRENQPMSQVKKKEKHPIVDVVLGDAHVYDEERVSVSGSSIAKDNTERTSADCYFSRDGGATVVEPGDLRAGDKLYRNPRAKVVEREPDGSETGERRGTVVLDDPAATHEITADLVRGWMKAMGIEEQTSAGHLKPADRPTILPGRTVKMKTGCGTLFVTVNTDEHGNPIELFAHHGKAGICSAAQCEAIGRLSSLALRVGVDPNEVAGQLRGITCHETAGMGPAKVLSCADGIAKAIIHAIGEMYPGSVDQEKAVSKPVYSGSCPKCGGGTIREAGCVVCKSCGWEKCS